MSDVAFSWSFGQSLGELWNNWTTHTRNRCLWIQDQPLGRAEQAKKESLPHTQRSHVGHYIIHQHNTKWHFAPNKSHQRGFADYIKRLLRLCQDSRLLHLTGVCAAINWFLNDPPLSCSINVISETDLFYIPSQQMCSREWVNTASNWFSVDGSTDQESLWKQWNTEQDRAVHSIIKLCTILVNKQCVK